MYQSIFDNAVSARESLQAGKLDRVRPRKRTKRHIRGGGFDSTVSIGTLRLCDIRGTLESGFEMQRSKTQARMHESFLNACARFLYSDDTNAPDFTDILEDNQWDDLRQQVLCMTPRRVRHARPRQNCILVSYADVVSVVFDSLERPQPWPCTCRPWREMCPASRPSSPQAGALARSCWSRCCR